MEFGIFAQLFVPDAEREADPQAEHKRIMKNVQISIVADRAGFKYVWIPEHHFLDQYSHMPGPEVFGSFVAAQTDQIHIGAAILNVNPKVNHPARIAEKVALMDHLYEGRFEFGTGRGSSSTEVFGFGIEDLEITKEMYDEAIAEIPKMWEAGEYPGHEGRFFSMPPRTVLPKPYSDPHPPIWVAAGSPPTFTKAAKLGMGTFCFTHGKPSSIAPLIQAYKDAIGDAEPVGKYVNDNIACVTNMVCHEDRDEAFRIASESGMNYYSGLQMHWLDNIPKPDGAPEWPDHWPEPTPEQVEWATKEGLIAVGDPDDCAAAIRKWEEIGADQLIFSPTTNFTDAETIIRSMELFGKEVIPQFDTDPVHRTTRQREAANAPVS